MSVQERKLNIKCNKILKKKKLKVFDSYDGSYMDPKINDLHSQLYNPVIKINDSSRENLMDD